MIHLAGKAGARSSEGMRDTPTGRMSDTLNSKTSENPERSKTPAEHTSETPALTQTAVSTITLFQFEALSQRVTFLEATITNMHRTLEEVKTAQLE